MTELVPSTGLKNILNGRPYIVHFMDEIGFQQRVDSLEIQRTWFDFN